ncbi:MAG: MFS transporter [Alphaproteobacteria bacterium]|nr:MFS transporter [Alphaproteobacteria bacterium]
MSDKYISHHKKVTGFSFANLGFFTGFAGSIIGAVYSLVLLDIFGDPALVGMYVSFYFALMAFITIFASEVFKRFAKAPLLHTSLLIVALSYFMMAFPIAAPTFITIDLVSGAFQVMLGLLVPLFMADFAHGVGMEKLNARRWFFVNLGALTAPIIALSVASEFGIRTPFFLSAALYFMALFVFTKMRIKQQTKKFTTIRARRTLKSVWINIILFFRRKSFIRAYIVMFSDFSLVVIRTIYVPIMVVQNNTTLFGLSIEQTLGVLITLMIIPYIVLAQPAGRLAKKYGKKIILSTAFLIYGMFALWASFADGYTLLAIFVLWHLAGAFIEPMRDLPFFDAAKKAERIRFMGIYRTATSTSRIIVPMLAAALIFASGSTSVVLLLAGAVAIFAGLFVLKK